MISRDPQEQASARQHVQDGRTRVAEIFTELDPLIRSAGARALFGQIQAERQQYIEACDEVVSLVEQGRVAEASAQMTDKVAPRQVAFFKAVDELQAHQVKSMKDLGEEVSADTRTATFTMLVLIALAALLGLGLAWRLTRSITRTLGGEPARAVAITRQIADGDLTVDVAVRAGDGSSLMAAMKEMRDNLAGIVNQVRQSSDSIATGSNQIASGNVDLSQRTEEQASNLQQTAASMEQLAGTVKNSAANAHEATQLAASASGVATKGGEVVGQVVETMHAISASSNKIADIIGVIDGIAFQTNILALNAAVEAARAGEQGRGFAVVAGEVRTLAQRSAEAAREIKELITASVERVEAGAQLVDAAGVTMKDIVEQVQKVEQLIGEISSAANEQTSGIGQVGDAVSQLDQVTQQNAALVEESASASESLRHQAMKLIEAVGAFKLAA
jgi:methyl-accepting chemotaxis protein